MPTMVEQKKRDYELTEPEYIDHRVDLQGIDTPGTGGHRVTPGVGYTDKGRARLSRTHRKGFSRVKYT